MLLQVRQIEIWGDLGRYGEIRGGTGDRVLLQVKQIETTATLMASIRSACAESCPVVLSQYDALLRSPQLSLSTLERVEFDALGAMLDLEGSFVASRAEAVRSAQRERRNLHLPYLPISPHISQSRSALLEWRNPELLFRYYDDNRQDERMALTRRWRVEGRSGSL